MVKTNRWEVDISQLDGPLCQWITAHGGPTGFTAQDMNELGASFLSGDPIPGYAVIVTAYMLNGIGAYWLPPHNLPLGDQYTGCSFG